MDKDKVYDIAHKIYEDMNALNNGWGMYVEDLTRSERLLVNRLVNNWIRQDYY